MGQGCDLFGPLHPLNSGHPQDPQGLWLHFYKEVKAAGVAADPGGNRYGNH